ncbi:hypothetical protein [Novosphingobium sp. PhB165]|uniref:hypothetical protein n=1 Tax=Novosphingobium sp. PhB165 TaxID=2485105 RepID=UPI00140544DE|nr:hypothetical protein [Novosphingobium sp. PhB165]
MKIMEKHIPQPSCFCKALGLCIAAFIMALGPSSAIFAQTGTHPNRGPYIIFYDYDQSITDVDPESYHISDEEKRIINAAITEHLVHRSRIGIDVYVLLNRTRPISEEIGELRFRVIKEYLESKGISPSEISGQIFFGSNDNHDERARIGMERAELTLTPY